MSRFLRKRRMVFVLLLVTAVLLVFTSLWIISVVLLLGLMIILLNRQVIHKIHYPLYAFRSNREIKHYGILVIGDIISKEKLVSYIDKKQNVISIMAPDRSLEASWQILRHSVSVINEGDTCVIVDRGKSSKKPYTIFDIPFLHPITRKELQLDESYNKKMKYPLLYEPVRSLRFLCVWGRSKYQLTTCPHDAIVKLCHKKDIKLIYLHKA